MSETKDSNPKAAYGDMKVGLSSVPMAFVYGVACAMTEGGMKYGKHNYREMGCKHSTYFDAAVGHLVSWHEGEDIDEESGLHHLLKAAASIAVMYDSIVMKNDNDDRPIRYPEGVALRINPVIAKLKEQYPNPVAPFTQKRKELDEQAKKVKSSHDDLMDSLALIEQVTKPVINDTLGVIPAGSMVVYSKDDAQIVEFESKGEAKKFDDLDLPPGYGPYKPVTEKEIDRVLTWLFAKAGNPDFMVFEPKGTARMTPTILKEIEEAFRRPSSDDQNLLNNVPPGYGGRPTSETEAKMRASEAGSVLDIAKVRDSSGLGSLVDLIMRGNQLAPKRESGFLLNPDYNKKRLREDEGNPKAELHESGERFCHLCGELLPGFCACHPVLKTLGKHDGYKPYVCKGCPALRDCQSESEQQWKAERKGMHCSDCSHYPNHEGFHTCDAGKLILQKNPPVGDCPLFKRETE